MKFEKKVKQIASVEKDIDKVLKAARLQRYPQNVDWSEVMYWIMVMTVIMGSFGMLFALIIFGG